MQEPAPSCRQQPSLMNGLFLIQEVVWLLSHTFYLTPYRGVCRCHIQAMQSGSSRWKYGANCSSCCHHKDVGSLSMQRRLELENSCFCFCFLSCIRHCNEFLTGKRRRKLCVTVFAVTLTHALMWECAQHTG